jgi:hypothetical protein
MSTYFKMFNTLIEAPDPDAYVPEYAPVVARRADARPITQGREIGTCTWAVMSLADWHDMRALWANNLGTLGTFVVPPVSGGVWSTWRSVSAYIEPPTCEFRGNVVQNVTLRIIIP